ncbi:glycosyltransferase family 25 protein [Endozoicomonas sp.]|uniref:glycosyltransferase family 25 protein n=1 Tax=Endozoicomonas sp. TaxID=1892382 RepID=UPI003AF4E359
MDSTIHIFIINLQRSEQRRTHMQKMLAEKNISAHFFTAIDYQQPDFSEICFQYNDKKRKKIWGNSLAPGEIACYASHYKLWEKCIELDRPIIVLEDDIILSEDFSSAVNVIEKTIERYEYIRLAATFKKPFVNITALKEPHMLVRYLKGPRGTQAYALSPCGAKKLLNNSKDWVMAVDHYIDMSWFHRLPSYALHPLCVKNGSYPTDTGSKEQKKPKLWQKLIRECYAAYTNIRRLFFNLKLKINHQ